jgi:hypothetical protein
VVVLEAEHQPVLARPLDRNDCLAPRIALAAAEPRFQVEHRRVGRQRQAPDPQPVRRQQLLMAASGAFDLDEIARPKVGDASGVEGHHLPNRVADLFSEQMAWISPLSMGSRCIRVRRWTAVREKPWLREASG